MELDPKQIALQRINQTVILAQQYGFDTLSIPVFEVSFIHILDMQARANENFESMSVEKLNRWLGWIQASIVSSGIMDLEQMKALNR